MLSDVRARKYSKIGVHTHSILEKFAFDTTLIENALFNNICVYSIELCKQ